MKIFINLLLICFLIITLFPLTTTVVVGSSGGTIVGDSVVWENYLGSLEVYPHTARNGFSVKTQYAVLNSNYNAEIDVGFRFDYELDLSKCDIWLMEYDVPYYQKNYDVEWYLEDDIWQYDIVNITYDLAYKNMYVSKKHLFQYSFEGGTHNYYIENFNVKNDRSYQFKWQYNTPIDSDGKWLLCARLSDDHSKFIELDPWFSSDFQYMKALNIENPLQDYPMFLKVGYNGGGNVSCEGNSRTDFKDIRFVRTDNVTELYHWSSNQTDSDMIYFHINNSYNDSTILMYYGDADADNTTYKNGTGVFRFFDDFEHYSVESDIDSDLIAYGWLLPDSYGYPNDNYQRVIYESGTDNRILEVHSDNADTTQVNMEYNVSREGNFTFFAKMLYDDDVQDIYWYIMDDVTNSPRTYLTEYLEDSGTQQFRWYSQSPAQYNDFSPQLLYSNNWIYLEWIVSSTDAFHRQNFDSSTIYDGGLRYGAGIDGANRLITFRPYYTSTHSVYFDNFAVYNNSPANYGVSEPEWLSFGSEQTEEVAGAPWVNNVSTVTDESPANASTGVCLLPTVSFIVTDDDSNESTVDYYVSDDGVSYNWTGGNSSVLNTTLSFNFSSAYNDNQVYFWQVSVNEGNGYNVTHNFTFQTVQNVTPDVDNFINNCSTVEGVVPVNETTGVCLTPTVNVTVKDQDGNASTVSWSSNYSGSWVTYQVNLSVLNESISWNMSFVDTNSQVVYWRISVEDEYCNRTFEYSFTTVSSGGCDCDYGYSKVESDERYVMADLNIEPIFFEAIVLLLLAFLIYKVSQRYYYVHAVIAAFAVIIVILDIDQLVPMFLSDNSGWFFWIGYVSYMFLMAGYKIVKELKS